MVSTHRDKKVTHGRKIILDIQRRTQVQKKKKFKI